MTAMKPALDLFIDANILFFVAFCLWALVQSVIGRGVFRHNYPAQLRFMKIALLVTLASPGFAHLAVALGESLWPKTPITLSDIAVAAYLRGDIDLPAVQFEALLNSRGNLLERLFEGEAPLLSALLAVLVLGALAQAARIGFSALRIVGAVRHSYLWRRIGRVDIRLSDRVSVPFAARGLRRRYVVLPSTLVTQPRDLRYILAHELQHLRDGDVEWELAFELARPLMYWNPAFGLWKRSFDRLRELSCDQKVIRRNRIAARDYMECLLGFCERQVRHPLPRALHVAFFRGQDRSAKRALQGRLLALAHQPSGAGLTLLVPGLAVVLALAVSLAAATVRQPGDWSQDRLMLSTIVNLERLAAINSRN